MRRLGPNEEPVLTLAVSYWICTAGGDAAAPEKLAPDPALPRLAIGMSCRISFPAGVERREAVFPADNTWSFTPPFDKIKRETNDAMRIPCGTRMAFFCNFERERCSG